MVADKVNILAPDSGGVDVETDSDLGLIGSVAPDDNGRGVVMAVFHGCHQVDVLAHRPAQGAH